MLDVELACQETGSSTDCGLYRLDINQEELGDLIAIRGLWNRKRGQSSMVVGWKLRSPLLLMTVLKSWAKRRAWAKQLLFCLDHHDGALALCWEIRLLSIASQTDGVLLEGPLPDRLAQRQRLHEVIRIERAAREIEAAPTETVYSPRHVSPIDFSSDEIDQLLANF